MGSLTIHFAFVSRLPAEHRVRRHQHPCCEWVYYLHSSGDGEVGGQSYSFASNEFLVVPPNVAHTQYNRGPGEAWCIGFSHPAWNDGTFLGLACDRNGYGEHLQRRFFNEINRIDRDPAAEMICHGSLQMMLGYYLRLTAQHGNQQVLRAEEKLSRGSLVVQEALDLIDAKEGICSIEELCTRFHISPGYMRRLFQRHTGESPIRHIIRIRLEKARRMLRESPLSVAEIAYECGFSSPYYFSRLFRQETGVSPSQYRHRHAD